MTMIRKLVRAQISALGDDEVEVVMSTDALARDGHILIPQGCRLENYRANPIVLWSHNPDQPIGNTDSAVVAADQISARVKFAPLGISRKADEIRGLTKAGVIRAVSVGFEPIEMEPLDPKKPKGGQRISAWELLELSFVSVPADAGALVTARAHGDKPMTERTAVAARMRPARGGTGGRAGAIVFTRGLYQVAQLCYLFEELGYYIDVAKWEAAIEGDASKVPAMLGAVLSDLGDALMAMTQEEIAEALAGHDVEPEASDAPDDDDDVLLVVEERAHIAAAPSPAVRAFRRGLAHAKLRAGKTLSADTVRCLREAKATHDEAMELHRSAMAKHRKAQGAIDDMMDRAGVSDDSNEETQTVDDSGGGENDDAARLTPDYRKRQAEILGLLSL
jgi:HK97 family phage prohead protease